MQPQMTFERYEIKFFLTCGQRQAVMKATAPHMSPDVYGPTTIRNIYFDTDSYRLIRRSLERPSYKEKLRLRSYCEAERDSTVFLELKKKYCSVVYKRRIELTEHEAMRSLLSGEPLPIKSQIASEIDYFRGFYGGIRPAAYISYEREAYYDITGSDLRITFDDNILCRQSNMTLCSEPYGIPVLEPELTLMEVKTSEAMPLWLTKVLSENGVYKTSFSKYGAAYTDVICRAREKGERLYA